MTINSWSKYNKQRVYYKATEKTVSGYYDYDTKQFIDDSSIYNSLTEAETKEIIDFADNCFAPKIIEITETKELKKYNLSSIMKRAHYLMNNPENFINRGLSLVDDRLENPEIITFSDCLKRAWKEAKEQIGIEKRKEHVGRMIADIFA